MTRKPELKTTKNGVSVCTFGVAVQRTGKKDEADFLNIVAWRGLADICAKYLVKGQQVAICGEIRTRTYETKEGGKKTATEIYANDVVFLGKPKESGKTDDSEFENILDTDDDMPF